MKDLLVTYLKYGNQYYGIEHTSINNIDKFYVLGLKKSKNQVDIKHTEYANEVEEIRKGIPKNTPVFLVVNTNSVLTKRITTKSNDDNTILNQAFPNLKLDEFYYEILYQDEYAFISICRKLDIDEIIKTYTDLDISVVDIALGALITNCTKDYIENENILYASNSEIHIADNSINSIERTNVSPQKVLYNINGIEVSNTELLSFSGALSVLLKNHTFSTNLKPNKIGLFKEFQQKRFFNHFLKIGLSSLLVLLLINFFVFNHYFNSVNVLQETSQLMSNSKERVTRLNAKVIKSKKMVDDIRKSNSSKSTFYLNEIMSNIPDVIILDDYNYQPLSRRVEENKPIKTNKNTIEFSGFSSNSEIFSDWVDNLESLKWVNHIEVINYENISSNKSNFSILIQIENDL